MPMVFRFLTDTSFPVNGLGPFGITIRCQGFSVRSMPFGTGEPARQAEKTGDKTGISPAPIFPINSIDTQFPFLYIHLTLKRVLINHIV